MTAAGGDATLGAGKNLAGGRKMRIAAVVMVAAMLAFLAPAPAAARAPQARGETQSARLGDHSHLTRLVLDVTQLVEFRTLVTDKGRRVLVGFPSVDWETNRHRLKPFGPITRYDFMRRGLKRGLLVIHTSRPVRVEHQFTLPPDQQTGRGNRLVLDLVDAGHQGKVPAPR